MRSRLDADGDGKVTAAELGDSRMARRFGDPTALDTDKNGDISAQEMDTAMEHMRDRMRERRREWNGSGSAP